MYPHTTTLTEKYWNSCIQKTIEECWDWQGTLHKGGYGQLYHVKKYYLAHRVSWQIHYGDIPKEMCVLHKCDNPPCTNPNHLFLGTLADNVADMHKKGRARYGVSFGEDCNLSKLTEEQVLSIRKERAEGKLIRILMSDYNLSKSGIEHILSRRSWSHI